MILKYFRFKFLLVVCLLINFILTLDHPRKCQYKKAKMNFYKTNDNEDKGRFLQTTTWAPIRIYLDYAMLDNQGLNEKWVVNMKVMMSKTVSTFQNLLKVRPVTKKLVVTQCDDGIILGAQLQTIGVDADLIIIPFVDFEASADLLAYAYPCGYDETTNRPVVGVIGWSNSTIFGNTNAITYQAMTALHELTHVLAFNNDLFPMYIDSAGKTLGLENVVVNATINGIEKTLVKTPKVVEAAKKHYGCDSIQGVELEDNGGEGTAGTHWEARLLLGDYMLGYSYPDSHLSEISLALFEDSGWYQVNHYTGGLFRYGKNEGCDFLTKKCVTDGNVKFGNEFCNTKKASVCTASRTSKAVCSLKDKQTGDSIIQNEDYFTTFKGWELADNCPVAVGYDNPPVYLMESCSLGVSYYPSALGELISADSSCFISSLTPSNNTSTAAFKSNSFAICYPVLCNYNERTYTVKISNNSVKCSKEGGSVSLNGFDGSLQCPDFNMICTQSNGKCSDFIDCVEKRVLPFSSNYDYSYDDGMNLASLLTVDENNYNTTQNVAPSDILLPGDSTVNSYFVSMNLVLYVKVYLLVLFIFLFE